MVKGILGGIIAVILIVAGPGGYRSRDFLRVGLPLTLLMLVTTLIALNLVFGRG